MRISDWSSDVCSSDLNVQMALLSHRRKVYSFWRAATSRYRTEAMQLLEQVGMHEQADRACSELAYGDVKRVELAMSLAGSPRQIGRASCRERVGQDV